MGGFKGGRTYKETTIVQKTKREGRKEDSWFFFVRIDVK